MKRKRSAIWTLLAVLCAAAIGCSDDEPTGPPGTSQGRVVNGSADSPNIDLYVDGLRFAPDLTFREFSQYMIVSAGNRTVEARIANSNNVLFTKTETFAA